MADDLSLSLKRAEAEKLKRSLSTAAPTLQERTQRVLGLDPTLKRGTLLPVGETPAGETVPAWPQFAVDVMQSSLLPGHVLKGGQYSPTDVTRAALDVAPGSRLLGSRLSPSRADVIRRAPTRKQLEDESRRAYESVAAQQITIPGQDAMKLVSDLSTTLGKEGVDPVLHPKAAGILDRWMAKTGNARDLTFEELEIMRRQAGTVAKSLEPDEQRLGSMMKEAIDDYVDTIPEAAGIKEARSLWRRKSKVQDIEEIFFKAENSASGFENGLRTGFRALLNNPKRRRGYSKAEVNAMQKVVNGGSVRAFLRLMRHLGPPVGTENRYLGTMLGGGAGASIGSAVGGPPGALVGGIGVPLAGHLAGRAAQAQTRQAADLAQALAASGSRLPDIATLREFLMRQPQRRLPGPLVGTQLPREEDRRFR